MVCIVDVPSLHFGQEQILNEHRKLFMINLSSPVLVKRHRSSQQNQQVGVLLVYCDILEEASSVLFLTHIDSLHALSVPENKLFIGMLSRTASEEDVRELFAPFGEIREIYMIRNAGGTSKCAAFLRFMTRESAEKAIENLHNNIVMDGSARPLIVKFADNKAQRQQRHMRHIRRNELLAAMGAPGQPYPAYHQVPPHLAMPPHSGGPQYGIPPQYGGAYPGPNHALHGHHAPPPHYMYPHQYAPTPPYGYQDRPDSRPQNPRPREGPAGANLFVYHLPHDLTDADLSAARLIQVRLDAALLEGAQLEGTTICRSTLDQAELRNANFRWAQVYESSLQACDLHQTDLHHADFTRVRVGAVCA